MGDLSQSDVLTLLIAVSAVWVISAFDIYGFSGTRSGTRVIIPWVAGSGYYASSHGGYYHLKLYTQTLLVV